MLVGVPFWKNIVRFRETRKNFLGHKNENQEVPTAKSKITNILNCLKQGTINCRRAVKMTYTLVPLCTDTLFNQIRGVSKDMQKEDQTMLKRLQGHVILGGGSVQSQNPFQLGVLWEYNV